MSEPSEREVVVFSAARRLPPAERAEYLEEACAGDAALRQRVEELLQASEEAGGFLEEPAPGAQRPEDNFESPTPPRNPAAPGENVGDRIVWRKCSLNKASCLRLKMRYSRRRRCGGGFLGALMPNRPRGGSNSGTCWKEKAS